MLHHEPKVLGSRIVPKMLKKLDAGILHGGLDGSRESVKGQVRQEACVPSWNNQLHDYYRRSRNF